MAKRNVAKILGKNAKYLLDHKSKTITKDHLHLPVRILSIKSLFKQTAHLRFLEAWVNCLIMAGSPVQVFYLSFR